MHLRFLELGLSLNNTLSCYRRSEPRSMKLCPRNWTQTLEKRGKLFPCSLRKQLLGDYPYLEPGYFSLVLGAVSTRPRVSSDGFRTLPRDPWLPLPDGLIFEDTRMGFFVGWTMNCVKLTSRLGLPFFCWYRIKLGLNSAFGTDRSFNLTRNTPCRTPLMKTVLDIGNLGSRGGIRSLLKRTKGFVRNPHRRVLRGCIFGF